MDTTDDVNDGLTTAEEKAFLEIRHATSRTVFEKQRRDGDFGSALLRDPTLIALATRVLSRSRGKLVTKETLLPTTLWIGGATHTWRGRTLSPTADKPEDGTIAGLIRMLEERTRALAPKGDGWVIEPTSTKTGRRTNADTVAIHAIFLDADTTGTWDTLLSTLDNLGFAYIAYQSGGYTAATPKWRVILPLYKPFITDTDDKCQDWKTVYHHARVVFGSVGRLHGCGFDPTTETPSIPWFLTERRQETDPPREVRWRLGASLDLMKLVEPLPAIEETKPANPTVIIPRAATLNDARLSEIVAALCSPMQRIRNTRRALYLSLAGALCDRGAADDTVAIVEAVSARCPGDDASKYNEHVHCARTTVEQWRQSGVYTRIGTLNEIAPEVAKALDEVLPDPEHESFLSLAHQLAHRVANNTTLEPAVDTSDWQTPVDHKMLRKFAVNLRRRKRKSEETKDAIHWILLDRLLAKKPLAEPVTMDTLTGLSRDESIHRLMGLLAFKFPRNTPVEAVLEMIRPSIFEMLKEDERPENWLRMSERSYVMSLANRLNLDSKKAAELAESQAFGRHYRAVGGKLEAAVATMTTGSKR